MKTIYKYRFAKTIKLPKGATVLSAGIQNNEPFIWCLVESDSELEERGFNVYATGESINACINQKFVSTIFLFDDELVYHIFEEIK